MVNSKGNGSGITINFLANVKDALDGTKKLEDGVENVGEKLDDVSDTAKNSGRTQESTLRDIERASKDTYDGVGDSADKGFGKATSSAKQAGQQIGDGLKDLATDTDHSIASVGSSVGGILAGIGSLVPVAGVAIGAVIGAVSAGLTKQWDDAAKDMEARTKTMYDAMLESGKNYLTQEQISKGIDVITGDPKQLQKAVKYANDLGLAVSDVVNAMAADGPQREALLDRLNTKMQTNASAWRDALDPITRASTRAAGQNLRGIADDFDNITESTTNSSYATQINRQAQEDSTRSYNETGEAVRGVGKAIDELPHGKTIKVDIDTSAIDRYLKNPKTLRINAQVFNRDGKRVD